MTPTQPKYHLVKANLLLQCRAHRLLPPPPMALALKRNILHHPAASAYLLHNNVRLVGRDDLIVESLQNLCAYIHISSKLQLE